MKLEDIKTREDAITYMVEKHQTKTDEELVTLFQLMGTLHQLYTVFEIRDMLYAYSKMLGIDLPKL